MYQKNKSRVRSIVKSRNQIYDSEIVYALPYGVDALPYGVDATGSSVVYYQKRSKLHKGEK